MAVRARTNASRDSASGFFPRGLWGPSQLELEVRGSLLVPKRCRPGMLPWSKLGFSPLPDICQPAKVKGKHIKHTHIVCVSCKFFGPWVHFPNLIKECSRSVGCHLGSLRNHRPFALLGVSMNLLSTIHCAYQFHCHLEGHGCDLFTSALHRRENLVHNGYS